MIWKILLSIVAVILLGFTYLLLTVPVTWGTIWNSLFGSGIETPQESTVQARYQVPEGFTLGIFARDLGNVRFIEFTDGGDLIATRPRTNHVLILRDTDNDGVADEEEILFDDLYRPHGIDFLGDYLYIAESTGVVRVKFDHETGKTVGDYERVISGLADVGNHWTKSIRFGPDGLLYLSSGSTCNVCIEEDDQRATITRYNPDGSGEERFATGLRNSVGLDWAPFDNQLYATDNGRDLLGDDYPPCELNKVEQGKFYGWPYVNGFGDLDPDFGDEQKLAESTSPVHGFRAHNAPLGMRFMTAESWPNDFKDSALVALHGSWNRSDYDGYSVVSLHRNEDGTFEERDFLSGFELDGDVLGRPVDVAQGPDDCAYISDDFGGAIFRVCYGQEQAVATLTQEAAPSETGLEHIDAEQLQALQATGEQLYRTRGCVACHTLKTDDIPVGLKPLTAVADKYNVESLSEFYKTPTPPMPPVLLNEEDELAMSAYLLSL